MIPEQFKRYNWLATGNRHKIFNVTKVLYIMPVSRSILLCIYVEIPCFCSLFLLLFPDVM